MIQWLVPICNIRHINWVVSCSGVFKMNTETIVDLIQNVGVLGAMFVGITWKLNNELEKRDTLYNNIIQRQQEDSEQRIQEMRNDINLIREEAKEEKRIFSDAVASFEGSVREFSNLSNKMTNLEHDVRDIKTSLEQDVREIRNDIKDLKNKKRDTKE